MPDLRVCAGFGVGIAGLDFMTDNHIGYEFVAPSGKKILEQNVVFPIQPNPQVELDDDMNGFSLLKSLTL